jgi:glycosyltransferase involved in cell wall biosynthesis
MKLGIITAEIEPTNGWSHLSLNLIKALQQLGVELRVVAAKGVSGVDAAILPRLVASERAIIPKQYLALPRVKRILSDCDVIHTLVEPFAPLGVGVTGRRPHILTVCGTYASLPLMRRFPASALYRSAFESSVTVAISHYTEQVLLRAAPKTRSEVIALGVDAAGFAASAAGAQPFAKRGPVVLFVGAVKARKGTLQLVQAIARVRELYPDVRCVVAGSLKAEPDYVAQLRAEIVRLDLNETVLLPGHVSHEDLMRWYRTADLFCVPSMNVGWRFEGFGQVHLEAGAFGLPAIGTRECGAADAIDDGITGLLVSQMNIEAELPEAILKLLGDPALRMRMGEANRSKAERTTWESVAAQYRVLYEKELASRA